MEWVSLQIILEIFNKNFNFNINISVALILIINVVLIWRRTTLFNLKKVRIEKEHI